MAAESETVPTSRGRKKKGMKRFKGFITGQSRRERRKSKQSQSSISEKVDGPDDSSTLYGADLDASVVGDGRSVSSASLAAAKQVYADPVQIILLIMDPATRRFELLQLEFDSAMSKVSDIFKQIPEAATEEVLQKTTYKAIITPKGEELKNDAKLSDFASGAAIVIAVPESAEESLDKCAAMAVPILTNSKVHKMLLSVGIKAEDLPEKPPKKPVKVEKEVVKEEEPVPEPEKVEEQVEEEIVEPPTIVKEPEPLPPIEEAPAAKKVEEKDEDDTNYFVIGVLFAIFAHLFFKAHMSISAPLAPGSTMSLGRSKNSCGLLGSVPFYECEPKSMTLGSDGILSIFEGDELVFSLEGKLCGADEEGCVDGVVVDEDGTLNIGGEKAKAKMKSLAPLTPWPFAENVVYKSGIRNLI